MARRKVIFEIDTPYDGAGARRARDDMGDLEGSARDAGEAVDQALNPDSTGGFGGFDFDKIEGGFSKVTKVIGGAGVGLVGGLAAAAFEAADTAIELDNLSRTTGLSVDLLSRMQILLNPLGHDVDDVGEAFKTMAEHIEDARRGGTRGTEALERLGFTVADFEGLTPDEVYLKFAAAVAEIEDPTLRAAYANEFFSRDLDSLFAIIGDGEKTLRDHIKAVEDHLVVTDLDIEKAREIKASWNEAKLEFQDIAVETIPILIDALELLNTVAGRTATSVLTATSIPVPSGGGYLDAIGGRGQLGRGVLGQVNLPNRLDPIDIGGYGVGQRPGASNNEVNRYLYNQGAIDQFDFALPGLGSVHGDTATDRLAPIAVEVDGDVVATANSRQLDRTSRRPELPRHLFGGG